MGLFTPNVDKLIEKNDVDKLLQLTHHKKPEIRLSSFLALAKSRDEKILAELRKLLKDPDPRVRTIATLKFGELGDEEILEHFRSIIINGSQRDKIEALRILADRGHT